MNFEFTDEQQLLRASLRSYLGDHCSFADVSALRHSDTGWDANIWHGLATRLGILGVSLPETVGGLGRKPIDIMIIMEELGESLAPVPFFETVVIAGGLLAAAGDRGKELAAIIAGDDRYAFAWAEPTGRFRYDRVETSACECDGGWVLNGTKSVVAGAPWATRLLVTARTSGRPADPGGISLFLIDPATAGVELRGYRTIDGRRAADVYFRNALLPFAALVGPAGGALPEVEKAGDAAIAAIGAEAVGVMRRLLQDTIDYTRQRRQFGQPIASFQALQHRMVDMFMHLELATSAVYLATLSLEGDPGSRASAASAAKVTIGNACRFIGQNAVQLHGGMGMTDELPVGHYLKRAMVIESEFGSVDYHTARFAELSRSA